MHKIIITAVSRLFCFSFMGLLLTSLAHADVRLPRLLSDGAVLQREKPITFRGWADEGEDVRVKFAQQERRTTTKEGRWQVTFPAMKAGGPFELTIQANNTLHVTGVGLGYLWIAARQSEMQR